MEVADNGFSAVLFRDVGSEVYRLDGSAGCLEKMALPPGDYVVEYCIGTNIDEDLPATLDYDLAPEAGIVRGTTCREFEFQYPGDCEATWLISAIFS